MPPAGVAEAPRRIALLIGEFGDGGVERTLTHLAAGLAGLGQAVELLVGVPDHAYLRGLPAAVRVRPLGALLTASLGACLEQTRPDILFTGKLADDLAALAACSHANPRPRLVATVGTPLATRLMEAGNPLRAWWTRRRVAAAYRRLDGITAVSTAVAADLRRLDLGAVPVRVLCNPVIPDDLERRLDRHAQPPHPWLADPRVPALVAVGGLRRVKDFPTLIHALVRLRTRPAPRLLILGEGRQRPALNALIHRLGLTGRVALPGFVADPWSWIAAARLLALTSRREGQGNVLVEAMALGTPVVATDCPGGVRALLDDGRLGPLVPVGDARALAAAIDQTLAAPVDPERLRAAAAPYRIGSASRAYLDFFRELTGGGLQNCRGC